MLAGLKRYDEAMETLQAYVRDGVPENRDLALSWLGKLRASSAPANAAEPAKSE
jgi:hypothetical protein